MPKVSVSAAVNAVPIEDSPALSFCTEIGVALTTFGGLFMLLGVVLFFDGALLALGNVRPPPSFLVSYYHC